MCVNARMWARMRVCFRGRARVRVGVQAGVRADVHVRIYACMIYHVGLSYDRTIMKIMYPSLKATLAGRVLV